MRASVVDAAFRPDPDTARVCLSLLAADPEPGNVRLWVRRIRRRFPDSHIVLALWTYEDSAAAGVNERAEPLRNAEEWRTASGADSVVTNLQEALTKFRQLTEAASSRAPAPTKIPAAE